MGAADTVDPDDIAHLAETYIETEAAGADPIHLPGQQFLTVPGGIIAHTVCRGIVALQLIQNGLGLNNLYTAMCLRLHHLYTLGCQESEVCARTRLADGLAAAASEVA